MGGTLLFSFKVDNYLSIAQELEQAGFKEAAIYLRQRAELFRELWAAQEKEEKTREKMEWGVSKEQWRHCSSLTDPPFLINPKIRPDQITSSSP